MMIRTRMPVAFGAAYIAARFALAISLPGCHSGPTPAEAGKPGYYAEALSLAGAHLFERLAGRPMREWVVAPADQADRWHELVRKALEYVESGV